MDRRTYLQTAGSAIAGTALAGCASVLEEATGGDDRNHELVGEEAWIREDTQSTQTASRIDAELEIDPGYYAARPFEPQANVRYGCEWETDGNPFDVIFFDRREYDSRWRDEEEVQFDSGLTEMDTTRGSVTDTVQAGEYVIVFSNSEVIGTDPEGTVRVEVAIGASFV